MSLKKIINILADSVFLGITAVLLIPVLILGISPYLIIAFYVFLAMGYVYLREKEKVELAIVLILWPFVASILGLSFKALFFVSITDIFLIWLTPFGMLLFASTIAGTFLSIFLQQKMENRELDASVQN